MELDGSFQSPDRRRPFDDDRPPRRGASNKIIQSRSAGALEPAQPLSARVCRMHAVRRALTTTLEWRGAGLSSRTTDDDDCSGQSKVSQASRKLALAKSLSRWRPRHALPTQVQQPRQEPGGSDSDMYGPGSSGWRWTWTGGTIWVRLSSALALAAAPQTRTYVCARPCGGWGTAVAVEFVRLRGPRLQRQA